MARTVPTSAIVPPPSKINAPIQGAPAAPVSTATANAPEIATRYGGLLDRVQFFADTSDHARWAPVLDAIRAV